MKYVIALLFISACSKPADEFSLPPSWNVCPATDKGMTDFQKELVLRNWKVDGSIVSLTGKVVNIKHDIMEQVPVVYLDKPFLYTKASTVDTAFCFIPNELASKLVNVNKGDTITVSGKVMGECMVGALGSTYIDVVVHGLIIIK